MDVDATATDLPETEQAVGLDAILDRAIAASESAADPPPDAGETTKETGERPRDERGRFASSKDTGEVPASERAATDAKPDAEGQLAPEPAADPQQFEPHPRWNEAQKAAFAALPPEAKQFALAVQAEHEANFTRKSQEYADFRRTAEPLVQAVQPFQQYLTQLAPQIGITPPEMIRQILSVEHTLRTGDPASKYQAFAQLAHAYQVDIAALAGGQVPRIDPVTTQLRQELSELKQWRQQYEQNSQAEQARQISSQIEAFAKATDQTGQPKHPHFDRVKGVMAHMMATGGAATLEDAYAKAVEPIKAAIATELEARAKAADQSRREAVAKAEKAAPVKSSGVQPGGKTGVKGLDAHLQNALAQAGL